MDRYIRLAGAGEFRGEGTWTWVNPQATEQVTYWKHCKETGFLPVGLSCPVGFVLDDRGKRPRYVIEDDLLKEQFVGLAVPYDMYWDDKKKGYFHDQLKSLVKQVTA